MFLKLNSLLLPESQIFVPCFLKHSFFNRDTWTTSLSDSSLLKGHFLHLSLVTILFLIVAHPAAATIPPMLLTLLDCLFSLLHLSPHILNHLCVCCAYRLLCLFQLERKLHQDRDFPSVQCCALTTHDVHTQ